MDLESAMTPTLDRVVLVHRLDARARTLSDYRQGRRVYGMSFGVHGEAEYRIPGQQTLRVSSGSVLFFDRNASYLALTKSETYQHYTVNFELLTPPPDELLSKSGVTSIVAKNPDVYRVLFSKLAEVWKKKQLFYELRSASLLYELFAEFFAELATERYDSFSRGRLLPAKELIDSRYMDSLSLSELAGSVGMSTTNFRREFSRVFGTSVMRYRDEVRLLHAKDALASGTYNVSEVARMCGFEDLSYFARFFKKHTGTSPTTWRKEI